MLCFRAAVFFLVSITLFTGPLCAVDADSSVGNERGKKLAKLKEDGIDAIRRLVAECKFLRERVANMGDTSAVAKLQSIITEMETILVKGSSDIVGVAQRMMLEVNQLKKDKFPFGVIAKPESRALGNILIAVGALIVTTAAIVGGIYLYRKFSEKNSLIDEHSRKVFDLENEFKAKCTEIVNLSHQKKIEIESRDKILRKQNCELLKLNKARLAFEKKHLKKIQNLGKNVFVVNSDQKNIEKLKLEFEAEKNRLLTETINKSDALKNKYVEKTNKLKFELGQKDLFIKKSKLKEKINNTLKKNAIRQEAIDQRNIHLKFFEQKFLTLKQEIKETEGYYNNMTESHEEQTKLKLAEKEEQISQLKNEFFLQEIKNMEKQLSGASSFPRTAAMFIGVMIIIFGGVVFV